MRSVLSAFWRRASSRGRVVCKAVKRGWVSVDCLSSRRMSADQCNNWLSVPKKEQKKIILFRIAWSCYGANCKLLLSM